MPFLYFAAIVALIGLMPMPYVGYTLVKIGVVAGCLLAITKVSEVKLLDVNANIWLVGIAVLYNPIFPIYLTRELWIVIDIVTAIILFYIAKKLASNDGSDDLSIIQSKLKSIDKSKIEKGANSYVQKMLLGGVLLLIFIAFTEIFIK
jgi:hypothetical protein